MQYAKKLHKSQLYVNNDTCMISSIHVINNSWFLIVVVVSGMQL